MVYLHEMPEGASNMVVNQEFPEYSEILAGWLFITIRDVILNSDRKDMNVAGRADYVPNAILKHTK